MCDELFAGSECQQCLVPGHFFPNCDEAVKPHEQPVNQNRAGITIFWGMKTVVRMHESGETLAEQDVDHLVNPVYDRSFDISLPNVQTHILAACDLIVVRDDLVQPKSEVCFMRAFKNWVENVARRKFPITGQRPDEFAELALKFLSHKYGVKYVDMIAMDDIENPKKVLWVTLSYRTQERNYESGFVALKAHTKWDDILARINSVAPPGGRDAHHSSDLWPRMFTEVIAVTGTLYSMAIVISVSFAAVWIFTASLRGALCCAFALLETLCVICGLFRLFGWSLGIVEAIGISILLGAAIDYPAHIVEAFMEESRESRKVRVKAALGSIGVSVLNASVTTAASVFALLFCVCALFIRIGAIILFSTICSIVFALGPLPALLSIAGPKYYSRHSKMRCKIFLKVAAVVAALFLVLFIATKFGATILGPSGTPLFS